MRFACDRCKTRYSIADERVRGKILKIRCKACANVIVVREGMDVPAEVEPDRSHRPTTLAPHATVGSGGAAPPAAALTAAFSSAMSAPAPSALEDEWYLSRDGDQHGPFDLRSAKAWVSQHPYDAELYCWCEGFDDWLPVDRIAHFRNLRPRPQPPTVPAPQPLAAPRAAEPAPPAVAVPAPAPAQHASPQVARTSTSPVSALREAPAVAREPSRPLATQAAKADARQAALSPLSSSAGGRMGSGPVATVIGAPPIPAHAPSPLSPVAPSAAAAASAEPSSSSSSGGFSLDDKPRFAASLAALETRSPASAATRIEPALAMPQPAASPGPALASSPMPGPALASSPMPAPARGLFDAGDLGGEGFSPEISASGLRPAVAPSSFDDELEFGEVSRVVRIADLNKSAPRRPAAAAGVRPGSEDVVVAAPAWGVSAGQPAPLAPKPGEGAASRAAEVPVVIPASLRRNHALLLGLVAVGLLGAGVTAFVLLHGSDPEDPLLISTSNRDVRDLTIRPDDPRRPAAGSGAGSQEHPVPSSRPTQIRRPAVAPGAGGSEPTPGAGSGKVEATPSTGPLTPLGGDEVEAMSQRNSGGLQRCYEQALKKDIFLDVKSIKVTISIGANGVVSNVAMSSHADHALGQCMVARIRNWRFRPSTAGLDAKFTVAFGRT